MKGLQDGKISRGDHAEFALNSALHNRTVFALHADDVFWGLQQPQMAARTLEFVATHLATALNRRYAIGLARDLIQGMPNVSMQYGAVVEFVKFIANGLFRRKDNVTECARALPDGCGK